LGITPLPQVWMTNFYYAHTNREASNRPTMKVYIDKVGPIKPMFT